MEGMPLYKEKIRNNIYYVKNAIDFGFLSNVICLTLEIDFQIFDPVEYTCKLNLLKEVELLLSFLSKNKPSILKNSNYLIIACNCNNSMLLELLINYKIQINIDVIINAVKKNNIHLLKILLRNEKFMFLNSSIIDIACKNNNIKIVKLLLKKIRFDYFECNNTAITVAVENNNLSLVRLLIKNNFQFDEAAFIKAVKINNTNIVYLLLKNKKDTYLNKNLMYNAIKNNNINIVNLLLKYDCDYDTEIVNFSSKYPKIEKLLVDYINLKKDMPNIVFVNNAMDMLNL